MWVEWSMTFRIFEGSKLLLETTSVQDVIELMEKKNAKPKLLEIQNSEEYENQRNMRRRITK